MASATIQAGTFERLSPSRFVSFTFPNPQPGPYGDVLRIAVLDSPLPPDHHRTAAMLVPPCRESDWIFSTIAGHLQLLLASSPDLSLSRLILAGDPPAPSPAAYARPEPEPDPDPDPDPTLLQRFQQSLLPLLLALSPKASFTNGLPQIPFLTYEDNVLRSAPLEILAGPIAGEMLVEDVELGGPPGPERRRRLRFKRMPNLVQTQVRLLPDPSDSTQLRPELGSLAQPYLGPMAAGLSLIAPYIDEKARSGSRPRALCVGVGGGALLMFLHSYLEFDVLGMEADDVVLGVARQHFGLINNEFLQVCVGDGIEFIEQFARGRSADCVDGFDAIIVDLDSVDATTGISAPPLEFVQKSVLSAARSALSKHGIVVINVIAPEGSFYNSLISAFREVFIELHELDVGNGENYVLIAATSAIGLVVGVGEGPFTAKLKEALGERYMDHIRRI